MSQRTLVDPNAIPRELWPYRQFGCWKYADRGKAKPDKVPVNPRNLSNAGVTWPNTWTDIRTAVTAYQANNCLAGISYVLTAYDPYVMLDLDNCILDGEPNEFACNVMNYLGTYAERSPSGRGLRLFVHCQHQPDAIKRPEIEIYSKERFATLTGDLVRNRPIARFDSLDWFIDQFVPKPEIPVNSDPQLPLSVRANRLTPSGDDAELWDHIFCVNPLAKPLFNNDLSDVRGNGDPSRAVILLLNCLALWTNGDAARMGRMIRQTHLSQAKWNERRKNQTWLDGRIQDAISFMAARGVR